MNGHSSDIPRVPMQLTQGCLVVSIQIDLNDDVLKRFQRDLLEKIRATQTTAVVLDVSGVDIMDRVEFESLQETMQMARLMGARTMLVGIKPEIACSLMDFDLDFSEIQTAVTLDRAFEVLLPILTATGEQDETDP